jgi:hypothetical protein
MEEYGRTASPLVCEDELGRVAGVLPLMETRGIPIKIGPHVLGRRVSSLPRTPCAGPISVNAEATKVMLKAAVDDALRSNATLQIKSSSNDIDSMVEGLEGIPWRASYVLRLNGDGKEVILDRAKSRKKLMWSIKRSGELGVKVRWSDSEGDLRKWYGLYVETVRWHGSLPRNYRFFLSLWRRLHDSGKIRLLLAEHEDGQGVRMLSGKLYLAYGETFHCWLNGRLRDGLKLRPNDAMHWRAINDAYQSGYRVYDFGEVDEHQAGLIEFKSKWGAVPRRTYRYYFPAPCEQSVSKEASVSKVGILAKYLWRRVPLFIVVRFADWVYSYL